MTTASLFTAEEFVAGKRLALVGASRQGSKFGNIAMKELKERGYQVVPIHPSAESIDGECCFPDLRAVAGQVDGVLVVVPPTQAAQVLQDAKAAGIERVWLQQGAESPEVLEQARSLELKVISGKCILMYAPPVRSFHKFHRIVTKVFGKL